MFLSFSFSFLLLRNTYIHTCICYSYLKKLEGGSDLCCWRRRRRPVSPPAAPCRLFSGNGLQGSLCKRAWWCPHRERLPCSSLHIVVLHQTFVFLLGVLAPAFFFLSNVQNQCADLLIKTDSPANRAALPQTPKRLIFLKTFYLRLSAGWNL